MVSNQVTVDCRAIEIQGISLGSREGRHDVRMLQLIGTETTQAGQCVFAVTATSTADQFVVSELAFRHVEHSRETLGLRCGSNEEPIVSAPVSREQEGHRGTSCARTTNNDVLRISTELYIEKNPLDAVWGIGD